MPEPNGKGQPEAGAGGVPPMKEEGPAANFTRAVIAQFRSMAETTTFSVEHRRLAQHLFIQCDLALREAEKKRLSSDEKKLPMTWENVNMEDLAKSAVSRIDMGLDALIPGHIWPVLYFDSRARKYRMALQLGYVGRDWCHRKYALEPPLDIKYVLVYSGDTFVPRFGALDGGDSYILETPNPWERGELVGGFGYIMFDDHRKNKLVLVSKADFEAAQRRAQSDAFWKKDYLPMCYKTIVNRTTPRVALDPAKMSESYAAVLAEEVEIAGELMDAEVASAANREPVDLSPPPAPSPPTGDGAKTSTSPPAPKPDASPPEGERVTVKVGKLYEKAGTTGGRPWKRTYFKDGTDWYGTIDDDVARDLKRFENRPVTVIIKRGDRGIDVLAVNPRPEDPGSVNAQFFKKDLGW